MKRKRTSTILETESNRFEKKDLLGQGGAGEVYRGRDSEGRNVAIKILNKDARSDQKKRFKNEIQFLSEFAHPHVVSIIDFNVRPDDDESRPFYVMPLFSGSLRNLMNDGIPPDQVLPLFLQILDGLEAVHQKGVVHRDIKPENMLFDQEKNLVISDFGIAHLTTDQMLTDVKTKTGDRLANFLYAAPEQRRKAADVGATADIFALGLILNELFTGNVPQGTSFQEIGKFHPKYAFLDDVVANMIGHDSAQRPQSIAEVRRSIQIGGEMISGQIADHFPGLNTNDISILKWSGERTVAENRYDYDIRTEELLAFAEDVAIPEDEIFESLELLDEKGFIDAEKGYGTIRWFSLTTFGLQTYAESFVPEFKGFADRIIKYIVNNQRSSNIDVAKTLNINSMWIDHVLDDLDSRGEIAISKFGGGLIKIHSASAELRRSLRS